MALPKFVSPGESIRNFAVNMLRISDLHGVQAVLPSLKNLPTFLGELTFLPVLAGCYQELSWHDKQTSAWRES